MNLSSSSTLTISSTNTRAQNPTLYVPLRRHGFQPASPLLTLPYEIQFYIVDELDFEDTINLARTCTHFQFLEREERACRRVAQNKIPYAEEVSNATKASRGFARAVRCVAKRRAAFASASPFSVAIVALADEYTYLDGMLCYRLDDKIRLLNLHRSTDSEMVIDIPGLLEFCLQSELDSNAIGSGSLEVLNYADNVLVCLGRFSIAADSSIDWLIALDVEKDEVLMREQIDCTEDIFVRHTAEYIYYGTHSELDEDYHKKWVIRGYQLRQQAWFDEKVHLPELVGAELGQTVCFEIRQGYFYAVSNQTSFEPQEVDWTSYYHCVRFPVDCPHRKVTERSSSKDMWRRQHSEGPIDDRWTVLSLEVDETTGELNIHETRREWQNSKSTSSRTYYTTAVKFPAKDGVADVSPVCQPQLDISALPNDPIVRTLSSSDRPYYMPAQERPPASYHPGDDGDAGPSFILAKTPVRYYHSSAQTYIDLVNYPSDADWSQTQRLCLRAGSRRLNPPTRYAEGHPKEGLLIPEKIDSVTGEITKGCNQTYTNLPLTFWPPPQPKDGPFNPLLEELHNILNPPSHLGNVSGICDERSMVYATGGKENPSAVVFLSFDPSIQLKGLKRWYDNGRIRGDILDNRMQDLQEDPRLKENKTLAVEKPKVDRKGKLPASTVTLDADLASRTCADYIWRESPMYLQIGCGYDFSR